MSKIWMKVTNDEFELPLVLARSAAELARKCGTTRNAVNSAASHARHNGGRSQYISVDVDDDPEDGSGPGEEPP